MVAPDFYLNRILFPVIFTLLLFLVLRNKKSIKNRLIESKNKGIMNLYFALIDGIRLDFGDWKKTVVLPFVASLALMMMLSVFGAELHSLGEPLWFALSFSGFLSPVAEEFLVRGFLLGCFFYFSSLTKEKYRPYFITGVLMSTSLVFLVSHDNFTIFQSISRFSSSLLYGILYLAYRRNLLPPIVAHASWNWFLIASDCLVYKICW